MLSEEAMVLDISRYNMAPVEAARARLTLAQEKQRYAYGEISLLRSQDHATPSSRRVTSSLEELQLMQREAFACMDAARKMLHWLAACGTVDIPVTDEQSLRDRTEQRSRVEAEYSKFQKESMPA
jgi:hypothetical protein